MLSVAILAGGLATRLRPITERIPKSLVSVVGRPFIHWQLALLAEQGIGDVVLCVGHLGDQVEAEVGDGARHGLRVRYSCDGDRLLGTAGALKRALPLLGDRFFVLYGDSYLPISFASVQDAHVRSGMPALMTVLRNQDRWDRSNVLFRGGRLVAYDKQVQAPGMEHIDYGLGVIRAEVLQRLPSLVPIELADVYHSLAVTESLAGYEVHERFYEVGSPSGLAETEDYLRKRVGR